MAKITIVQLGEKLGVSRDGAYGFIKFLVEKGLATKVGTTHVPGTKGKGSDIYQIDGAHAGEAVMMEMSKIDGSAT